jgi:hypothetical protein
LFDNKFNIGIYGTQTLCHHIALWFSDSCCKSRHLTVDVRDIHNVSIYDCHCSDPGTAQHFGSPRANTAKTNYQQMGLLEPALPVHTEQNLTSLQPIIYHKTAL